MLQWTVDFTNDPNNDYELMIEILCNGEDVGVIKYEKSELTFILFAHSKDITIPFDWLFGGMKEVNKKFIINKNMNINPKIKYSCSCCGYRTLDNELGCFDICPVCYWKDGNFQRDTTL